jgi:hypothetical protein
MIHDNFLPVRIQISISEYLSSLEKTTLPHCPLKSHLSEMEMLNEWMLETGSELSDMLVSLLYADSFSWYLTSPRKLLSAYHSLACGLLVVKRKGHNVTHWVTKRMHGILVIRYYCLYRNLLRSWANPFPFVSYDRVIFHGLSRWRPYSEWRRMGSSAQRGISYYDMIHSVIKQNIVA